MHALRHWLRDTAGGLPATFWYLWAGLLVNRAGAFVMLFLSLYLTGARGASEALAGAVVGAYGAGGAVGVLLGGMLADRWGRRAPCSRHTSAPPDSWWRWPSAGTWR